VLTWYRPRQHSFEPLMPELAFEPDSMEGKRGIVVHGD
jgi:hypothetical protein